MVERMVAKQVKKAKLITVLTGAGISRASGIPTYRGEGGLWEHSVPDKLPSQSMFLDNPEYVWEYHRKLKKLMEQARPNEAHFSLLKLEKHLNSQLNIVTQNIDGLHLRAGTKKVSELHGNIFRCICTGCKRRSTNHYKDGIPKCPHCSRSMRPDVVWFGENLPVETLKKAMDLASSSDVFIIVGTSGVVQPAASLPRIACASGALVIEFNIERSAVSVYANLIIMGRCEITLPKFVEEVIKC